MDDERGPGMARVLLLIVALVVVAGIVWMLLARSGEPVETTYETDVQDLSGGELIVTDPTETGVPVDVPDVEMTNVPPDAAQTEPAAPPAE